MADKEIIIDCINVNECEFYGYDGICKLYSGSNCSKDCSNYPNCNYKQLKRKEQECEELYNEKMKLIDKSIEQKCKIRELIDENAIKEVVYKINGKCAKTVANKVKEIRKIVEGKDCKWSKYKQALDEIEKITKNDMKFKYNDKKFTITQILSIINKTKGSEYEM